MSGPAAPYVTSFSESSESLENISNQKTKLWCVLVACLVLPGQLAAMQPDSSITCKQHTWFITVVTVQDLYFITVVKVQDMKSLRDEVALLKASRTCWRVLPHLS